MGSGKYLVAGVLASLMLLSVPLAALADSPQMADSNKLRGELAEVVAKARPDQLIPVSIVMCEQAAPAAIQQASRLATRAARREAVGQILKSVAERSQHEVLGVLRAGQASGTVGRKLRPLWIHNLVAASVTPETAKTLAARADVAYLNYDKPVSDVFPVEPSSGRTASGRAIECGVDLMNAPRVWSELGITGNGVVVGVIDTGCTYTHPDLINQVWTNPGETPGNGIDDDYNGFVDDVHGWNFEGDNNDLTDFNSHGTHVTGTVAGDGTNGQTTGMAPDCAFMILKFWNSFSGESTVWNAMQYGADNGADVLTASLGWPHMFSPDRPVWRGICENTIAMGVVVVYAAGNEGSSYPPYDNVRTPGDVPDVITIGACNCSDDLADFSSRGPSTWQDVPPYYDWPYPPGKVKPSVTAPGVDTLSTSNDGSGYGTKSGTSMATPHVAGAIALILEADPNLDHFGVKQILMDTAVDYGVPGFDNEWGMGRVDAYEAVVAAMQSYELGDLNCDGLIDGFDIDHFVQVLADWDAYIADHDGDPFPPCDPWLGDLNQDGRVDGFDIEPFVELL
ncbi:MAG: S8 family serine peptidase [Planctomycetes bacterium]|nr:S8 family serine peptidase [Planctomycetota bacterium]